MRGASAAAAMLAVVARIARRVSSMDIPPTCKP
jgi:hypothetical protein